MKDLFNYLRLTQPELKSCLYSQLKDRKMNPVFGKGYIYSRGNIPIMLVAHMDTVADTPPKEIIYDGDKEIIYNPNGILGGDDRCGVYAIMNLLKKYRPYVLFTEDEEIGLIGAMKAVDNIEKPDVKYIIEFDRRGRDDCVFYKCGNEDFIEFVESYGFNRKIGSCSDILVLGQAWDIATANVSSGFYNEHTSKEYISYKQLIYSMKRVELMIKDIKKAPYFDYQKISNTYDVNPKTFRYTNNKSGGQNEDNR